MKLICYDIGSYSLKKAEYIEDKNLLREISWHEFHVKGPSSEIQSTDLPETQNDELNPPSQEPNQDEQIDWLDEIVEIFKKEKNQWATTDKIVLILPEDFSTSRYLNLPVNSKKKASQILPFQLEDSIPFSMNDIIYQASFNPGKESTEVLVNILGPNDLENLYSKLNEYEIYFDLITTNIGALSTINPSKKISERNFGVDNFALIDIGHLGTSCFFFHNGRLVSNHNSISSGALLTENLADSYNISIEEATHYKHDEAFFLTSNEQESASKDEKIFALFMERTFANLITDFSRWNLGYRTKTNAAVEKIYLVGGSSKIQNICPFIEDKFGVTCESLSFINPKVKLKNVAHISSITSLLLYENQRPLNFLSGRFKARNSSIVPLRSSFKLFNRASILSMIVCFFVLVDLFLNIYSSSKLEKNYKNKLLKNKINITKKQQLTYRKKPKRLVSVLDKKIKNVKNIKKAIDSINNHQASKNINALYKVEPNNDFIISSMSYEQNLALNIEEIKDTKKVIQHFQKSFNILETKEINEKKIELLMEKL
jgi:general secretion pathway protein L